MGYGLGVDIGTSTIAVAVLRGGQTRPIALVDDSDQPLGPQVTQDTGPASAVRALSASLRETLDAVVRQQGDWPDTLVLTYQARQGRYGRDLMDKAARLAGLDGFTVISDLEAAAASYASRERLVHGDRFAVYDLGASAFSVGVAGVTGPGVTMLGPTDSVKGVGGLGFQQLVLAEVDRRLEGAVSGLNLQEPVGARAMERLGHECEQAKIQLSSQGSAVINVLLPYVPARSGTRVRQSEVHLTGEAFEAMIVTPLESTLEATHRALRAAEVTPEELAGVLLIGGSARIPLVAALLSTSLGVPVRVDPEPQDRVAHGAALISAAIEPLVVTHLFGSPAEPAFAQTDEFARPVSSWSTRLGQGLVHRRRALAVAAVAATVLVAGVGYQVIGPDSTVVRADGPAGPSASAGPGGAVDPSPRAASTIPAGSGSTVTGGDPQAASSTGRTQPASGPTSTVPSDPASSTPARGVGTSQPPVTASSTPTVTSTGSPTASTTSTSGLVINIGELCYDLSRPEPRGGFAEVPCS